MKIFKGTKIFPELSSPKCKWTEKKFELRSGLSRVLLNTASGIQSLLHLENGKIDTGKHISYSHLGNFGLDRNINWAFKSTLIGKKSFNLVTLMELYKIFYGCKQNSTELTINLRLKTVACTRMGIGEVC
jgi:hypothetical protein